jgi:hypothetical protein
MERKLPLKIYNHITMEVVMFSIYLTIWIVYLILYYYFYPRNPNESSWMYYGFLFLSNILLFGGFLLIMFYSPLKKKYDKEIKAFDSSLNNVSTIYITIFDDEIKEFAKRKETVKKEFIDKISENLYVKGATRKFTYTTVPIAEDNDQKTKIKNLYATQNPNVDTTTFDGKIKFN